MGQVILDLKRPSEYLEVVWLVLDETRVDEWLFDLMLKREVLEDFEVPIRESVKICKTMEEFGVVAHTVENLIVLTSGQMAKHLNLMAEHIKNNVNDGSPLAIVAMAWGNSPDSSQALVQMLKPKFRRLDNVKFFNSVPEYEKKTHIEEFPKFVLVDDFAGTGQTVLTRLKHIINHAKGKGVGVAPHVCLLFGMERAFEFVSATLETTHFCNKIRAGISGYFTGEDLAKRISDMKRLEQELAPEIDGIPLPSMGHGEAEALFFIKDGNAPNSNFPIFWWPKDASSFDRVTIMERAEL